MTPFLSLFLPSLPSSPPESCIISLRVMILLKPVLTKKVKFPELADTLQWGPRWETEASLFSTHREGTRINTYLLVGRKEPATNEVNAWVNAVAWRVPEVERWPEWRHDSDFQWHCIEKGSLYAEGPAEEGHGVVEEKVPFTSSHLLAKGRNKMVSAFPWRGALWI